MTSTFLYDDDCLDWGDDYYSRSYEDFVESLPESEPPECPVCGGLLVYLGRLGRLNWLRCRNCGIDCNVERGAK